MAFKHGDKCKGCGVVIDLSNATYSGMHVRTHCQSCHAKREKDYKSNSGKGYNLKQRYGITSEEYNRKLELQLGGCAVCKQPCKTGRNLAVDHNHKTKIIRDLLCQRCNVILGLVGDDELLLFDLIEYLKRHEEKVAS